MFKFLRRYGYRFLTNRQYRSYVFQLLRERSTPVVSDDVFVLSSNNDFSDLKGSKVFMCGGCELTFMGDHMTSVGLEVYHTFENGRASEPMVEVSDSSSELFTMMPNLVVFSQVQSYKQILMKLFTDGTKYSDEDKRSDLKSLISQLQFAIDRVNATMDVPVFLVSHFFIHSKYRGTHEYKSYEGSTSSEEMNLKYTLELFKLAKIHKNVYLIDVNRVLEVLGKKQTLEFEDRNGIFDHPTKLGSRLIAEDALYQLKVLNPKSKRVKCAVFDLDNTLWKGVLREDGVGNIYPKWTHLHVMRALSARGILLAICSKNDPDEAENVEKILERELFDKLVSVKLNWLPKSENLKQIAKELNIGLDAIAFFDDNPVEREEVRMNAPSVSIFDDTQIVPALDMVLFEPIGSVTEESAARTLMYKEQAKRAAAESGVDPSNLIEFFKSCQFKLDLKRPDVAAISRMEELIQRTNQLNATGNRTTNADLTRYIKDSKLYYVSAASLKDKFGDYGLIGVCIAKCDGSTWEILEFNLSCRAMGKHVEHAILCHLCSQVRYAKGDSILIRFKQTSRNKEMQNILRSYGFIATQESDEWIQFLFTVDKDVYAYPEWFSMTVDVTSSVT